LNAIFKLQAVTLNAQGKVAYVYNYMQPCKLMDYFNKEEQHCTKSNKNTNGFEKNVPFYTFYMQSNKVTDLAAFLYQ